MEHGKKLIRAKNWAYTGLKIGIGICLFLGMPIFRPPPVSKMQRSWKERWGRFSGYKDDGRICPLLGIDDVNIVIIVIRKSLSKG